jgi:hypothetical protein
MDGLPASENRDEGEGPGYDLQFQPILVEAFTELRSGLASWRIEANSNAPHYWIVARHEASRQPEQGWKLHISAAVRTAEDALRRALGVLLGEDADFKVNRLASATCRAQ